MEQTSLRDFSCPQIICQTGSRDFLSKRVKKILPAQALAHITLVAMKNIKFTSTHINLKDAVEKAGIDLSYNPKSASEKIKDIQGGYGGRCRFVKAYVAESSEVYFIFVADDGLRLLNKFEPFSSCLHDGSFRICSIDENEDGVEFSDVVVPKSARKRIIEAQKSLRIGFNLVH